MYTNGKLICTLCLTKHKTKPKVLKFKLQIYFLTYFPKVKIQILFISFPTARYDLIAFSKSCF